MRKLAFLAIIFSIAAVACGSEVAATGAANVATDPTATPTVAAAQPTATAVVQPTATPQPAISEQRIKDLEFRLSSLERLMSADDGMFSLEDDLANADGRLRAQQRCINALVMAAGAHQHGSDTGGQITGPAQFGTFDSSGLDATAHPMLLAVECGPVVDEAALAQLADNYGIDVK